VTDTSPGRPTETGPRRYRSPRRKHQAEQTRALILDAASGLFAQRGWSATGMRDVATAAGVAVETVYANFAGKAELLKSVLDVAVVGDDEPVPLEDRAEFTATAEGEFGDRVAAAARLVTTVHERTNGLHKALLEAAAGDAKLAKTLQDTDESRRVSVRQGAELVAQRSLTQAEVDGLWAVLSVEVFRLLVERSGWSTPQYESWAGQTIRRLVA
jgi:AcrR family transcriptional regulator